MRMIELTKINREMPMSSYVDTDEPGENGNPVASVAGATSPTVVNADAIRCFYPRRDEKPGTRLTFIDGGGFAVTESFEAVKAMVLSN